MGNVLPTGDHNWRQNVNSCIHQTHHEIEFMNPFSRVRDEKPYAEPIEDNIYAPRQQLQGRINLIIENQPLIVPPNFQNDSSYEYDQKFWKKEYPNIVIQGHWSKRVPHGLCTIYFPGRNIFVSYFDNGVALFQDCLIIFQNCSYYHGKIINFKFSGNGKYVNYDQTIIYEGQWQKGIPVGKGQQIFAMQRQIVEYEGEFNSKGQKQGKNSIYTVKSQFNQDQTILQYQGGFKQNDFLGESLLSTKNGKYLLKGQFSSDNVGVKQLQTEEYIFEGNVDRSFANGKGKFRDLKSLTPKTIYQGDIMNGKLHGHGSITYEDGSSQNVCWFQGIKMRHIKNFHAHDEHQFYKILQLVEDEWKKASKYSELTKKLNQYFQKNLTKDSSSSLSGPKQHCIFQMITEQKVRTILQSSSVSKSGDRSPSFRHRKQIIIELSKGKNMWVNTYKIHN